MNKSTVVILVPSYVQTPSSLLNLSTDIYNLDLTSGSHTTFAVPINTGSASGVNVHGLIRENGSEVQFTSNMTTAQIASILAEAIKDDENLAKQYPVGSARYNSLINGSSLSQLQLGCIVAKGNTLACNYDVYQPATGGAIVKQIAVAKVPAAPAPPPLSLRNFIASAGPITQ